MDFLLDDHQKDLQRRARAFFDEVLEPMELEVDAYGGLEEHRPRIRQAVRNTGFAGINHSLDDGGHGFSIFEQFLVNEQLGRTTCGLWADMWQQPISVN
jgi:alkylation response protein AidB-like acyl-CoA dehydrogenase